MTSTSFAAEIQNISTQFSAADPLNISIPKTYGRVLETVPGEGVTRLIYLQDAHAVYEAQKSISSLIRFVSATVPEDRKVVIALEGAWKDISLEKLKLRAGEESVLTTADFFVRRGLLSGAGHAALLSRRNLQLKGVEDPALYRQNREAYLEASGRKETAMRLLGEAQSANEKEKLAAYGTALIEIDRRHHGFKANKLDIRSYLETLKKAADERGIDWAARFPNIRLLDMAQAAEQAVRFEDAEKEIEAMIDKIRASDRGKAEKLASSWIRLRKDRRLAAFFKKLMNEAAKTGLSTNDFPETIRYKKYLELTERIDAAELFTEIDACTAAVKSRLFRSEEEKRIDAASTLYSQTEKLATLEATREEYEAVRDALGKGLFSSGLEEALKPAGRFYEIADRRDRALFENTRALLDDPETVVFLVTGGFHSRKISSLFKQSRVPHWLVAPRMTEEPKISGYAEWMGGWNTPLHEVVRAFGNDAGKALENEGRTKIKLGESDVYFRLKFHEKTLKNPVKNLKSEALSVETSPLPFLDDIKPKAHPIDLKIRRAVSKRDFPSFKKQLLSSWPAAGTRRERWLDGVMAKGIFDALVAEPESSEEFLNALLETEKAAALEYFSSQEERRFARRARSIKKREKEFLARAAAGDYSLDTMRSALEAVAAGKLALEDFFQQPANAAVFSLVERKYDQALTAMAASLGQEDGTKPDKSLILERERVYHLHDQDNPDAWTPAVDVFGSARVLRDYPEYRLMGVELGRELYDALHPYEITIRTGAGPAAAMEGTLNGWAKRRREHGHTVTKKNQTQGIRITLKFEQYTNPYVELNEEFKHFVNRKLALHENSVAAIALPGGIGTFDEIFEVLRRGRVVILLEPPVSATNLNGESFWEPILNEFYKRVREAGLEDHLRTRPVIAKTPRQAAQMAAAHARAYREKGKPFHFSREHVEEVKDELRASLAKLNELPRAYVFAGRPRRGQASRELQIAEDLARSFLEEGKPVRVVTRGPLFDRIFNAAEEMDKLDLLQAVFFIPPGAGSKLTRNEKEFRESHPEQFFRIRDASNQQVLAASRYLGHAFTSGTNGTMSRLFDLLQIIQTQKIHARPVLLLGRKFYGPLFGVDIPRANEPLGIITKKLLYHRPPMISPRDINLAGIADSAAEARTILLNETNGDATGASLGVEQAARELWQPGRPAADTYVQTLERQYPPLALLRRHIPGLPPDAVPFAYVTGFESSDPLIFDESLVELDTKAQETGTMLPYPPGVRRRDEFTGLGHHIHLAKDLELSAEMGAHIARIAIGLPFVMKEDGNHDWSRPDFIMQEFRQSKLKPAVDLMHFGVPDWAENHFQDETFPEKFAEFTRAFLVRYPDVEIITPVNEPFVTAVFSGLYGMWNERKKDPVSYARTIKNVARAAVLSTKVVLEENERRAAAGIPPILILANESAEYWHPNGSHQSKADFYNAMRYAILDLVMLGKLHVKEGERPIAEQFLLSNGWTPEDFEFFSDHFNGNFAKNIPANKAGLLKYAMIGPDYYATGEHFLDEKGDNVHPDMTTKQQYKERLRGLRAMIEEFAERYSSFNVPSSPIQIGSDEPQPHGYALLLAETNRAVTSGMLDWMDYHADEMVELIRNRRPIFGYTWYSSIDQMDWDTALGRFRQQVNPLGIFNLDREVRPDALAMYQRVISRMRGAVDEVFGPTPVYQAQMTAVVPGEPPPQPEMEASSLGAATIPIVLPVDKVLVSRITENLNRQQSSAQEYQYGLIDLNEIAREWGMSPAAVRHAATKIDWDKFSEERRRGDFLAPVFIESSGRSFRTVKRRIVSVLETMESLGGITSMREIAKKRGFHQMSLRVLFPGVEANEVPALLARINENQKAVNRLQFALYQGHRLTAQSRYVRAVSALNGRASADEVSAILGIPETAAGHHSRNIDYDLWNHNLRVLRLPQIQPLIHQTTKRVSDEILAGLETFGGFATRAQVEDYIGLNRGIAGNVSKKIDFAAVNGSRAQKKLFPLGLFHYRTNRWDGQKMKNLRGRGGDMGEIMKGIRSYYVSKIGGRSDVPGYPGPAYPAFIETAAPYLYGILFGKKSPLKANQRNPVFEAALVQVIETAAEHGFTGEKLNEFFKFGVPRAANVTRADLVKIDVSQVNLALSRIDEPHLKAFKDALGTAARQIAEGPQRVSFVTDRQYPISDEDKTRLMAQAKRRFAATKLQRNGLTSARYAPELKASSLGSGLADASNFFTYDREATKITTFGIAHDAVNDEITIDIPALGTKDKVVLTMSDPLYHALLMFFHDEYFSNYTFAYGSVQESHYPDRIEININGIRNIVIWIDMYGKVGVYDDAPVADSPYGYQPMTGNLLQLILNLPENAKKKHNPMGEDMFRYIEDSLRQSREMAQVNPTVPRFINALYLRRTPITGASLGTELEYSIPEAWVQTPVIGRALELAQERYGNDALNDGEPYLGHALSVALKLTEIADSLDYPLKPEVIAAAILHKIDRFPPNMAAVKALVTKMKKVFTQPYFPSDSANRTNTAEGNRYNIQNYMDKIIRLSGNPDVFLLVLADKIQTLESSALLLEAKKEHNEADAQKREYLFREVEDVYAPLLGRLGLHELSEQLKERAFVLKEPRRYRELVRQRDMVIRMTPERAEQSKNSHINKLVESLRVNFAKANIAAAVNGRLKNLYSVDRKITEKSDEYPAVSSIQDFFGFRVVVETQEELQEAVRVVSRKFKGVIAEQIEEKSEHKYGYRAVYITYLDNKGLPHEFQFLTRADYYNYYYGPAAHWAYKLKRRTQQLFDFQPVPIVENDLPGNFRNVHDSLEPWSYFDTVHGADQSSFLTHRMPRGGTVADAAVLPEIATLGEPHETTGFVYDLDEGRLTGGDTWQTRAPDYAVVDGETLRVSKRASRESQLAGNKPAIDKTLRAVTSLKAYARLHLMRGPNWGREVEAGKAAVMRKTLEDLDRGALTWARPVFERRHQDFIELARLDLPRPQQTVTAEELYAAIGFAEGKGVPNQTVRQQTDEFLRRVGYLAQDAGERTLKDAAISYVSRDTLSVLKLRDRNELERVVGAGVLTPAELRAEFIRDLFAVVAVNPRFNPRKVTGLIHRRTNQLKVGIAQTKLLSVARGEHAKVELALKVPARVSDRELQALIGQMEEVSSVELSLAASLGAEPVELIAAFGRAGLIGPVYQYVHSSQAVIVTETSDSEIGIEAARQAVTAGIPAFDAAAPGFDADRYAGYFYEAYQILGPERFARELESATNAYIDNLRTQFNTEFETRFSGIKAEADRRLNALHAIFRDAEAGKKERAAAELGAWFGSNAGAENLAAYLAARLEPVLAANLWNAGEPAAARPAVPRGFLSKLSETVRRFFALAFPSDSRLAAMFLVSDPGAHYSFVSAGYREAVRSILQDNPSAVVKIIHLSDETETLAAWRREFEAFGGRFEIIPSSGVNAPYLIHDVISTRLMDDVRAYTGAGAITERELLDHVSVAADESILDVYAKISKGGKELVSLARSGYFDQTALTEGAIVFELGLAHAVAIHSAQDLKQNISDDQLSIRGHRYTPNFEGIRALLSDLAQAWASLQRLRYSA